MDISFSQVGQNVAALSSVAAPTPVSPNDSLNGQDGTNVAESSRQTQVVQALADNNENINSTSTINIETAVAEVSEFVQSRNRQLDFSIDENSQRSVVRVTDSDSGDVIRQIPSEEVLALSERIKDLQTDVGAAVGVLFNKQV